MLKRNDIDMPIYQRIKSVLKERIHRGELKPGGRVPSENELSANLKVSRSQTRQALRDLVMEGYLIRSQGRPSVVASPEQWGRGGAIREQTIRKVVVACPASPRSYYTEHLVESFVRRISEHGIETMFYFTNLNPDAELRFLHRVADDGVTGLALWPVFRTRDVCELVEGIQQRRFPCVLFDRHLPGLHTDFVGTDNREAYMTLTAEIVNRGHKLIEYLGRDFHDTVQDDRYAGFRRALEAAALPMPANRLPMTVGFRAEDPNSEAKIRAMLAHEPRCGAIICSDGMVARFLIECLGRLGLRVPEDIEVASMDDEDPGSWRNWPMVRVVQDGAIIGRETAEVLMARISMPDRPPEQRELPARLVI